jgi:hypothetical protein
MKQRLRIRGICENQALVEIMQDLSPGKGSGRCSKKPPPLPAAGAFTMGRYWLDTYVPEDCLKAKEIAFISPPKEVGVFCENWINPPKNVSIIVSLDVSIGKSTSERG